MERDSYLIGRGVVSNQPTPASRFQLRAQSSFFDSEKLPKMQHTQKRRGPRGLASSGRRGSHGRRANLEGSLRACERQLHAPPRMERDFKSTGRTARCRPPKPSAVVVEYVSPITDSKIVVIRGSFEGVKRINSVRNQRHQNCRFRTECLVPKYETYPNPLILNPKPLTLTSIPYIYPKPYALYPRP